MTSVAIAPSHAAHDGTTRLTAATEILAALVSFDSVSRNSNLPIIDWIESYLSKLGIGGERLTDATGQKASLFATIGPAGSGGYVLSGHTDVVPVDGQVWTTDPFTLRVEGGRAYGRGACDMKGYLACCLAAVPDMLEQPLARPIHLAFSYDEEVGCIGVRPMLHRLTETGIAPAGAFIGEPTGMGVVIGHKGKRSVEVLVTGLNAHSSLAPQAVNAVHYGAKIVARIAEIAARLEREGPRDTLFDVSHSTGHVGVFAGGQALNLVPETARIVFEFRTIGDDDPDALVEEVRRYALDELLPQMRSVHPASDITFNVYAGFPGLDTAPEAEIVTLAKSLGGRNDHGKVAYGTEAGLFTAIAGVPAVVMGPGSITQAHKADEYIEIDQLAKCLGFIDRLIARCRA